MSFEFICISDINFLSTGHENGVHVLSLSAPGLVATVSTGESVNSRPANFKLRVWSIESGREVQAAIEDHGGPIRSIFEIPSVGFGTTSNDGSLRLRTSPDGTCMGECFHPVAEGGEGYVKVKPPRLKSITSQCHVCLRHNIPRIH
jgi:hypothetical protein